jgi:hypothetical protein
MTIDESGLVIEFTEHLKLVTTVKNYALIFIHTLHKSLQNALHFLSQLQSSLAVACYWLPRVEDPISLVY